MNVTKEIIITDVSQEEFDSLVNLLQDKDIKIFRAFKRVNKDFYLKDIYDNKIIEVTKDNSNLIVHRTRFKDKGKVDKDDPMTNLYISSLDTLIALGNVALPNIKTSVVRSWFERGYLVIAVPIDFKFSKR